MIDWYVVFTHPAAEARTVGHLCRQGFESYLPRYRTIRRHARRQETVWRPLFPRYLFVAFDVEVTPWRVILSTVGVVNLLRGGEKPLRVPAGVVEALRTREVESKIVGHPDRFRFQPGQPVQIKDGPFSELIGRLESLGDDDRVQILLELLGREVRVEVAVSRVQAA